MGNTLDWCVTGRQWVGGTGMYSVIESLRLLSDAGNY
jgi:hypothetical protein